MKRSSARFVLLGILAGAAAVRVWGLTFGLPYLEARPDETTIVQVVLNFWGGDLHPGFFAYPTFFMYVVGACSAVWGALSGATAESLAADPAPLYLLARMLAVTFGVATVAILYQVSSKLYDRRVGLLASFFLAFVFLHARDSHFGVTDVPMTFFIVAAMVFVVRVIERPTFVNYAAAATCAGLAVSTKYSAAPLCIAIAAVHLLYGADREAGFSKRLFAAKLWGAAVIMVAAFFAGSPFLLLDFSSFYTEFTGEIRHLGVGHRLVSMRGWFYHAIFNLPHAMGIPLLVASLAGIGLAFRHDWRRAAVLLSFPMAFYLVSGKGFTVFTRYMIPLMPFLCITAAIAVAWIADRAKARGTASRALLPIVALLLAGPSLAAIIGFNRVVTRDDSRVLAREWIEQAGPFRDFYQTGSEWSRIAPASFPMSEIVWDEASRRFTPGEKLSSTRNRFDGLPQLIVVPSSPLIAYDRAPEFLPELLARCYDSRHRIEGNGPRARGLPYDQQDAFYLPLSGFSRIVRPGPDIEVYQRKAATTAETCLSP